jgi:hypothetical protein
MKEIMINSNVDSLTTFIIYSIVRILGWIFYKGNKKSHTLKKYDLKKVEYTETKRKTKHEKFKVLRKIIFFLCGYGSFVYLILILFF